MSRTEWSSVIGCTLIVFGVYLAIIELTRTLTADGVISFTSGYAIMTGVIIVAGTFRGKR